jgi:hypothetical protein
VVLLSSTVVPVVFNVDYGGCFGELLAGQNVVDTVTYASGVDVCVVLVLVVRSVEYIE